MQLIFAWYAVISTDHDGVWKREGDVVRCRPIGIWGPANIHPVIAFLAGPDDDSIVYHFDVTPACKSLAVFSPRIFEGEIACSMTK